MCVPTQNFGVSNHRFHYITIATTTSVVTWTLAGFILLLFCLFFSVILLFSSLFCVCACVRVCAVAPSGELLGGLGEQVCSCCERTDEALSLLPITTTQPFLFNHLPTCSYLPVKTSLQFYSFHSPSFLVFFFFFLLFSLLISTPFGLLILFFCQMCKRPLKYLR